MPAQGNSGHRIALTHRVLHLRRMGIAVDMMDLRWGLWHRPVAILLGLVMTAVIAALPWWGSSQQQPLLDLWFSLHAQRWLLFLGLITIVPGRTGRVLWWLTIVITVACGAWWLASLELYRFQGRPLLLSEIGRLVRDPVARSFMVECMGDLRLWLYGLGMLTIMTAGSHGLAMTSWGRTKRPLAYLWIGLISLIKVGATLWVLISNGGPDTYRGMRIFYPPWHPVQEDTLIEGSWRADPQEAQRQRQKVDAECFSPGADPVLFNLRNRYPNRSFVVISMESHRLCSMAPWSQGSARGADFSPALAQILPQGIFFSNVIEAGQHTQTMAWSLVTGFDNHPQFDASFFTPGLAREGTMAEFTRAGYDTQWLQATDTSFANNDQILRFAVNRQTISKEERARTTTPSSWGMGDDDLLGVVFDRLATARAEQRRLGLIAATISNHYPFNLPDSCDGIPLTKDNAGGMRYADWAVGRFIARVRQLPVQDQPIIYITADHTWRDDLANLRPAGLESPEGFRIPGLLLLPDQWQAGTIWPGLFTHADVLDLLGFMTLPNGTAARWKFSGHHRTAVAFARNFDLTLVTKESVYDHRTDQAWSLIGRWSVAPAPEEIRQSLRFQAEKRWARLQRLWIPLEPDPAP